MSMTPIQLDNTSTDDQHLACLEYPNTAIGTQFLTFPLCFHTLSPSPLSQIIATRPKGSRGRGSRRGTSTPRPAASARPQQQGQASGARAKYAGAIPAGRPQQQQLGVNPLVQQQKQATSEALKVIISNLPLDVEEESVRVSPFILHWLLSHIWKTR